MVLQARHRTSDWNLSAADNLTIGQQLGHAVATKHNTGEGRVDSQEGFSTIAEPPLNLALFYGSTEDAVNPKDARGGAAGAPS